MNVADRVRIELAVQRFDFWLDFRGVARRRRRELRAELRGNLAEATRHKGVGQALHGIGSPRTLAHEVADASPSRARWAVGAYAALTVFAVLASAWLFSLIGFAEGVEAAGVDGREVSADLFPWGSEATVEVGDGGARLAMSGSIPAVIWIGSLLALLLAAQPWRSLGRQRFEDAHRPAPGM